MEHEEEDIDDSMECKADFEIQIIYSILADQCNTNAYGSPWHSFRILTSS